MNINAYELGTKQAMQLVTRVLQISYLNIYKYENCICVYHILSKEVTVKWTYNWSWVLILHAWCVHKKIV